jgi:hypothetical protein
MQTCVNSVAKVSFGGYVPSEWCVSEPLPINKRLFCSCQLNLGIVFIQPLSISGHMRHIIILNNDTCRYEFTSLHCSTLLHEVCCSLPWAFLLIWRVRLVPKKHFIPGHKLKLEDHRYMRQYSCNTME